jgi:hypothetical protein
MSLLRHVSLFSLLQGLNTMSTNSTIMINHDHLDWIRRNPTLFVNNLISRLNSGETDPFPGHARWHGDAMPGVQVVTTGSGDFPVAVVVGKNCGKKLGTVSAMEDKVEVLKELAHEHGCTVRTASDSKSTAAPVPRAGQGRQKKSKAKSLRNNRKR